MTRSLGKMFAYRMFDWRNSVTGTIQQTVAAFLELGEAIATRWIQTPKGRSAPADGSRKPRVGRRLCLRPPARGLVHAVV